MSFLPRLTYLVALLTFASILACGGGEDEAPIPPEDPPPEQLNLNLDHFLCYRATESAPQPYPPIRLRDQFDETWDDVRVYGPGNERFCNPVVKTVVAPPPPGDAEEPAIQDHDHHLLATPFGGDPTQRMQVAVNNQFTDDFAQLTVSRGPTQFLMLPTHKFGNRPDGEPHAAPQGLDHFRCYPAEGEAPNFTVQLQDQWNWGKETPHTFEVGKPVLHCNPADKTHGDKVVERTNPEHLVCYDIEKATSQTVSYRHQLVGGPEMQRHTRQLALLDWLCVPSLKVHTGIEWDTD